MIIGSKPRLDAISETPKILYGDYHPYNGWPIEMEWLEQGTMQNNIKGCSSPTECQRFCFIRSVSHNV